MINGQAVSISLFSGAFGLDLGLERAGFRTVSVVESDPDAVKTIALNRPYLVESAVPRDIRTVEAQELLEEAGRVLCLDRPLAAGSVDLISGGPPCQSFSTAGKRGAMTDPRGSLFMDFIRIVEAVQPRFFIMENVRGLLSASIQHRPINRRGDEFLPLSPDEIQGSALKVVLAEMQCIGYKIIYKLLQAADYGVPQNRFRVVFIGSRDSEEISFPLPTHSKTGEGKQKWQTLENALVDLVDPEPEFVPYSESRSRFLRLLRSGQNWRYLPDDLKEEAMGGAYKSGGGKVGFYRRLDWDKPSPTVLTCPHQKATDMCHPQDLRPISVRECARVQTFPDDWSFYGATSSKYRQIGNAVPVFFAEAIGQHIYKMVVDEKTRGIETSEQLPLFAI